MLICNHVRISVTFFGCVASSAWTQDRVSACTVIGSRYGHLNKPVFWVRTCRSIAENDLTKAPLWHHHQKMAGAHA